MSSAPEVPAPPPRARSLSRRSAWLLLALILLLGAGLRLRGLDWGSFVRTGLHDGDGLPLSFEASKFHPRESETVRIAHELDGADPSFELYGVRFPASRSGHFYYFSLAAWLALLGSAFQSSAHAPLSDALLVAARAFSALAGVLAIWGVYWLARRLFRGRLPGLWAAFVLACLPLALQASHFASEDSLAGLLSVLALGLAARAGRRPGWLSVSAAGAGVGLACATSLYLLPLLLPLVWWCAGRRPQQSSSPSPAAPRTGEGWQRLRGLISLRPAAAIALAVLSFALLSPSSWLHPRHYWLGQVDINADGDLDDSEDLGPGSLRVHAFSLLADFPSEELQTERGRMHLAQAPAVLYTLRRVLPSLVGWPLMVCLAAGCLLSLWDRRRRALPVALFGLLATLLYSSLQLKLLAPMRMLAPVFALLAGRALSALWSGRPRLPMRALATLVAAHLLLFGLAFSSLYSQPDPRAAALRWMAEKYPKGAVVVTERGPNGLREALPASLEPAARELDIRGLALTYESRYSAEAIDLEMVTGLTRVGEIEEEAVEKAVAHPAWQDGTQLLSELLIAAGELDAETAEKARASYREAAVKRREADLNAICRGVSDEGSLRTIADVLNQGQLLVFSADRWAARETYRLAATYYAELFSEDTRYQVSDSRQVTADLYGLRLARVFSNPPTLWGIDFGGADAAPEVWRHDHPRVFVFERATRPQLTSYSFR